MSQKIEDVKNTLNNSLNDCSKPWKYWLDIIESKSGIPRIYIFLVAVAICVIYLVFGYAAQLLCNFISIVYPAYISIKAIESKDKIDDTQWLTYWVLYAVFSIVEFFSIVVYSLIPCYYLLKCVFFIWCMLPIESNGSSIMYNKIIRPYFLKHQAAADECIEKLQDKAKEIVSDVLKKAK